MLKPGDLQRDLFGVRSVTLIVIASVLSAPRLRSGVRGCDGKAWPGLVSSGPIGPGREGLGIFAEALFLACGGGLGSGIGSRTGTRQQQGAGLVNSAFQGCILLLPVISKRYQHKIIVCIISEVHEPTLCPFAWVCK